MMITTVTEFSILSGYYFDKSDDKNLLLCSSLGMLFMFPWTMLVINPTNKILMDREAPRRKGEAWVREMITAWDRHVCIF